jgi:hypothetical protein
MYTGQSFLSVDASLGLLYLSLTLSGLLLLCLLGYIIFIRVHFHFVLHLPSIVEGKWCIEDRIILQFSTQVKLMHTIGLWSLSL